MSFNTENSVVKNFIFTFSENSLTFTNQKHSRYPYLFRLVCNGAAQSLCLAVTPIAMLADLVACIAYRCIARYTQDKAYIQKAEAHLSFATTSGLLVMGTCFVRIFCPCQELKTA